MEAGILATKLDLERLSSASTVEVRERHDENSGSQAARVEQPAERDVDDEEVPSRVATARREVVHFHRKLNETRWYPLSEPGSLRSNAQEAERAYAE
jgi:hypothetical protein